jgi:hypothetical protein
MIKLKRDKTIKRETGCTDRHRAITIELHPYFCRVRVKGKPSEVFDLPWDHALAAARNLDAREKLAAKGIRFA